MRTACAVLCCVGMLLCGAKAGSIMDVEHIVLFMQENRAYDHYYGVLDGVRGFNDRAAPPLPNGDSIFKQPATNGTYILPLPLMFNETSASCMSAPEMAYASDINIWNGGWMDAWNTARSPGYGMSYFNRSDLPYYYALMDAFTTSDQYFQSTYTATNPNRLHWFTGSNGNSVPGSGYNVLDDSEPSGDDKPWEWETLLETLENANVSWRVIQELDNFDDSTYEHFTAFKHAKVGSSLFSKGIMPVADLVTGFSDLVSGGDMPSVTFIVGPTHKSEHATNHPQDGEELSSQLISVLADPANKDVYAKTVFQLVYDEGGQFVDHHWTPVPPRTNPVDGKSTVSVEGELTQTTRWGIPAGNPIGMGFRVPMALISPWTRGHKVFSQVSDHTSSVQFIEKRFGVHCPNISPWRRAVASDLTSAFDWENPDYSWPASFPSTSGNTNASEWECEHLPSPKIPTQQSMPSQEPGTRVSLPLPYEFVITDAVSKDGKTVTVTMNNTGAAGAVFMILDLANTTNIPQKYTVEGGKLLDDDFAVVKGAYNLSLHGPNGFVRKIAGTAASAGMTSTLVYHKSDDAVEMTVTLPTDAMACAFSFADVAYGVGGPWRVAPSSKVSQQHLSASQVVSVATTGNWYDVEVTPETTAKCGLSADAFTRRAMGRMENGKKTTSDPAMGVPDFNANMNAEDHPEFPADYAAEASIWRTGKECSSRRSRMKDACWTEGADAEMHQWNAEHHLEL